MFYLLIGLTPQNCMQEPNLWLYAAVVSYWVLTLIPSAVAAELNDEEA
jgi:hypothetical protein